MTGCAAAPVEEPPVEEVIRDPSSYPPLVRILVDPPSHRSEHRWSGETAGLAVALIEAALIDLPGVVPKVAELAPAPGMEGALYGGSTEWRLTLEFDYTDDDQIEIFAKLCPKPGRCSGGHGSARRTNPGPAVAPIVSMIAETIGAEYAEGLDETWAQAVSEDDYAALLAGRAAAKMYGFMDPVSAKLWGHRTADPAYRAVVVDPTMAIAHWVKAREALLRFKPRVAIETLDRALDEGAHRSWLYAARAQVLARLGQWETARGAWDALAEASPEDVRYAIPRAEAYLQAGAPSASLGLLSDLPAEFQKLPNVAALRVAIAEAVGPGEDYEELLTAWAQLAPGDAEPLRRQVAYRLKNGRNAEALALLKDLEERGAQSEAKELAIAIAHDLGRFGDAADDAAAMGFSDLARRIRARSEMERGSPGNPKALAASGEPEESLVAARLLADSDPAQALQLVDRLLRRDPWMPEALAVRVRALRAKNDTRRLPDALAELRSADPALYQTLLNTNP